MCRRHVLMKTGAARRLWLDVGTLHASTCLRWHLECTKAYLLAGTILRSSQSCRLAVAIYIRPFNMVWVHLSSCICFLSQSRRYFVLDLLIYTRDFWRYSKSSHRSEFCVFHPGLFAVLTVFCRGWDAKRLRWLPTVWLERGAIVSRLLTPFVYCCQAL